MTALDTREAARDQACAFLARVQAGHCADYDPDKLSDVPQ